jgi:hypothetical protein
LDVQVTEQLFSGLSRDVRSGSSPGSGWATPDLWPLYHKGLIGRVLQRWLPTISTEELWSSDSDHSVLGHLHDHGPSPRLLSSAVWPALGRAGMMEATVFNAADMFWYPSLYQSCLGALRTIPSTSWLCFCSDMHCQSRSG